MYVRRTKLDDENSIAALVASVLFDKAEEAAKEHGQQTVYNYIHPNNDKIIKFLAQRGYNVLNLIEIRKGTDQDNISTKIRVGEHEFTY